MKKIKKKKRLVDPTAAVPGSPVAVAAEEQPTAVPDIADEAEDLEDDGFDAEAAQSIEDDAEPDAAEEADEEADEEAPEVSDEELDEEAPEVSDEELAESVAVAEETDRLLDQLTAGAAMPEAVTYAHTDPAAEPVDMQLMEHLRVLKTYQPCTVDEFRRHLLLPEWAAPQAKTCLTAYVDQGLVERVWKDHAGRYLLTAAGQAKVA